MGLRERTVFLLQLSKEPDVLDGDDGLVGKGIEEPDLFVRKGTDLHAANGNGAQWNSLTQQGRGKDRSMAKAFLVGLGDGPFAVALRGKVVDVDSSAVHH